MSYVRKYVPPNAFPLPETAKKVFGGKLFDVYQWPQEVFDGSVETFEMLKRQDTVKVIAIKDGKIAITRQRQPQKGWYYDFPGGRVDEEDVNELVSAKREMREETGMQFANWKLVDAVQPFAKMDWLVYTFLATGFVDQVPQSLDAGEMIEVEEISFDELLDLMNNPNAKDARIDFKSLEKVAELKSLEDLKNLPALCEY